MRSLSPQTLSVLRALADEPAQWQHGYELGQRVGIKAGSLYPILIRLCDRGMLEAEWESDPSPGRPRRHLYRIRAAGLAVVRAAPPAALARPADAIRPGRVYPEAAR